MADFCCQSDFGVASESQYYFGIDNKCCVQSDHKKLFTEDDSISYNEDFKASLDKLDHLINVLNSVYNKCKQNQAPRENISLQETEAHPENTEILTFNVNIKNDNLVHCHAKKGKYSLKIIDAFGKKSKSDRFGLHRCPSTLEIAKQINKNSFTNFLKKYYSKHKKLSSELSLKNSFQLQRSFHTLPNHLGNFSSNLIQEILSLNTEIQGLKQIFNNTECILDSSDNSKVAFKIGDLSKWLIETKMNVGKPLLSAEDVKLIHGKIRASHFCKFYKFLKIYKNKNVKNNKRKKTFSK